MPIFAVAGASSPVGLTAVTSDIIVNKVGLVNYGQPTPDPQKDAGLLAEDISQKGFKKFAVGDLEPGAVTNPHFTKPVIKRTKPYVWGEKDGLDMSGVRFPAAFVGFYNKLIAGLGAVDPLPTKTVVRDRQGKGLDLFGFYDAYEGIADPEEDIGQRMIPDALQTFDNFAGGFNRSVSGETGVITKSNWEMALDPKTFSKFIQNETFGVRNLRAWSEDFEDTLSKGWNLDLKGQGWKAFATGIPVRLGASLPIKRSMF